MPDDHRLNSDVFEHFCRHFARMRAVSGRGDILSAQYDIAPFYNLRNRIEIDEGRSDHIFIRFAFQLFNQILCECDRFGFARIHLPVSRNIMCPCHKNSCRKINNFKTRRLSIGSISSFQNSQDCRKNKKLLRQSLFQPFRSPIEWRVWKENQIMLTARFRLRAVSSVRLTEACLQKLDRG